MAEINQIVSNEAIEGIKKADEAIVLFDGNVDKLIQSILSLTKAFGSESANMKDVNKLMRDTAATAKQLEATQKSRVNLSEKVSAADRKAAADLEKLLKKEQEHQAALKLEVKTINDAIRQNKALTQERNNATTSLGKQSKEVQELNTKLQKNTEFIRQNGSASDKQRMNIGNYKSAVSGLTTAIAGIAAAWASLSFFKDSFAAYEKQEKANRKLLASLDGNKLAFKQLSAQSKELMLTMGVPDEAINQIQMMGKAANLSMTDIKKLTEASVILSVATGKDLDSAYSGLIRTLSGQGKALKALGPEFAALTAEQLRNGEAIDMVISKYGPMANVAASATDKMSASWGEFKELVGQAISGVAIPALNALNGALKVVTDSSMTWVDRIYAMRTGSYKLYQAAIDRKKAEEDLKDTTDKAAIRNHASTKAIIAQAVAQKLAESAAITAEQNRQKSAGTITKQITVYQKLQQDLTDLTDTFKDLKAANQPVPQTLIDQIIAKQRQIKGVEESVAAIGAGLAAIAGKGYTGGITLSGKSKAAKGTIGSRTNIVPTGAPKGTESIFKEGEGKDFALEQAQVTSDAIFAIVANSSMAEFDLKMSLLQKEKDAKLSNAKLTEAQKKKIEEEYAKKESKLKTEQFKKDKAAAIIQAIINTALAVTKASPDVPLMIAAGIAGAAQTAIIAAQKIPQFDKGTNYTPSTFIAGEKRPEWMITPKGDVSLVTRPTLFTGMAGATIIGGKDTERIMNAGGNVANRNIAPYIKGMTSEIVDAIRNKTELHISASGSRITERTGNYNKQYFNRKVSWLNRH